MFASRRSIGKDMIAVILCMVLIAVLVFADRMAKIWAAGSLSKIGSVNVIGDFLKFTYTENTGAAFSILEGKRVFLIAFPLILTVAAIIILFTRKLNSRLADISLSLISAGGIGNVIDRVKNGYVVDFIDFHRIHFAVFNVADMCVTIGVVLLIIYVIISEGNFGRRHSRSGIFTRRRF